MARRLLRRPEVERRTGLSTSDIYAGIKDGTFPGQVPADSGEGGQAFHLKADSESGRSRTAFR